MPASTLLYRLLPFAAATGLGEPAGNNAERGGCSVAAACARKLLYRPQEAATAAPLAVGRADFVCTGCRSRLDRCCGSSVAGAVRLPKRLLEAARAEPESWDAGFSPSGDEAWGPGRGAGAPDENRLLEASSADLRPIHKVCPGLWSDVAS